MAEPVPRSAQVTESDWMQKHKGAYLRTEAIVWYCGDEVCGCYQAQIHNLYQNKVTRSSVVFEHVWEGTFRTDHDYPTCAEELADYRRELKKTHPELEARIHWDEGVEYDD